MNTISLPEASAWAGACAVSTQVCLQAQGPDALAFLHGQLSQDVKSLAGNEARLGAYCSAKGRMLASALLLKPQDDCVWLLMPASVLPTTLKRLQMFVMRSKLQLSDQSAALATVGLVGTAALAAMRGADATQMPAPYSVQKLTAQDGSPVLLVSLPAVLGQPRWLWLGPQADASALLANTPALPDSAWAWLDVMSGVPQIDAATADQFVPQMVNYELVGGVNFKKGCYPGQEVVARSQYRGTAKRRLFLAHTDAPIAAGQEIFSAADPGQPSGMVVNASPWPATAGASSNASVSASALIELKLAQANNVLHLGSPDGPTLSLAPLPYTVPSDEEAQA
jgi:tRNA-modifying protein YgfZ